MTIIDLFSNFWSVNRTDPMPPMCAILYFYLLHECNIRRWINPFELRTRQIELELGLSRDAINDSRNALKQRGLIDFQNGKGKAPARYFIAGVKKSSKARVVGENDNKTDNKPTTNLQQTYNKPDNSILLEDIKTKDISPPIVPPLRVDCRVVGDVYDDFLCRFFSECRTASVEQVCISLKTTPEKLREIAEEIVNEWKLSDQKHIDYTDAAKHLINTARIKLKENAQQTVHNNRRGVSADSKKQKNWNATF